MKVLKVHKPSLANEQHFQFGVDVKALIEAVGAGIIGIAEFTVIYYALLEQEDKAMEFFRKSGLTSPIAALDIQRDSIYRGLCLITEGYSHSKLSAESEAAAQIQLVIDQYGDFRAEDYNKETGTITNFVQALTERCAGALALLRLDRWATDLSDTNNEFKTLMNDRYDDQATQAGINLRNIRVQVDKVYTQMMSAVDSASFLKPDDAVLNDFIARLNTRLADYKKMIALHQSNLAKNAAAKQ